MFKETIIDKVLKEAAFYIQKPVKLVSEGSTASSIQNALSIKDAGYDLIESGTEYKWNKNLRTNKLVALFENRHGHKESHEFLGFNWGYGGEGPRGLMEFSHIFKLGLNPDKVFGIEPINMKIEDNVDYSFTLNTWR